MYVLGIHPDGDYFKVALLSNSGKRIRILFLQEFKKDILDLNHLKKRLLKETKNRQDAVEVVSALTSEEVFIKRIKFPFARKSAVMKALPFQMEKLLPFSEEHVTTVAQIQTKKKASEAILYTFFNETMQSHLQEIKTLGFDPDTVTTISRGLFRFKKFFLEESEKALILYFGWEKSYLIYVDLDEVQHSLEIEIGFRQLIDAAREGYPGVDHLDFPFLQGEIVKYFKKENLSVDVKKVLEKLEKGLFRVFEYIKKKENIELIEVVHLGYSAISEEMLAYMPGIQAKTLDIAPHLEFDKQQLKSYAIEIGLALDRLDGGNLQLRVGEFVSSKQEKRLKGKIKILLGLSIACSLCVAVFITAIFIKKEKTIKEKFNQIVMLSGEESLKMEKKVFWPQELQKKIDLLVEQAKGEKHKSVLVKEPMSVSACLEELSKLKLSEVHYELLSYPTIENLNEGYQVRIEVFVKESSIEEVEGVFKNVEKQITWIEEKNGYQVVLVFKEV